jgi:hypothetical protein
MGSVVGSENRKYHRAKISIHLSVNGIRSHTGIAIYGNAYNSSDTAERKIEGRF